MKVIAPAIGPFLEEAGTFFASVWDFVRYVAAPQVGYALRNTLGMIMNMLKFINGTPEEKVEAAQDFTKGVFRNIIQGVDNTLTMGVQIGSEIGKFGSQLLSDVGVISHDSADAMIEQISGTQADASRSNYMTLVTNNAQNMVSDRDKKVLVDPYSGIVYEVPKESAMTLQFQGMAASTINGSYILNDKGYIPGNAVEIDRSAPLGVSPKEFQSSSFDASKHQGLPPAQVYIDSTQGSVSGMNYDFTLGVTGGR
jgi:hypothetical protein